MNEEDIRKVKKVLELIRNQVENCDGVNIVELNPFMMKSVLDYIIYLENQVDLNKFTPEEEDRMNILFIKGRYPDLVKSVHKSDDYDFGDKSWICELIKPINKNDKLKGSLYGIIDVLERIRYLMKKK